MRANEAASAQAAFTDAEAELKAVRAELTCVEDRVRQSSKLSCSGDCVSEDLFPRFPPRCVVQADDYAEQLTSTTLELASSRQQLGVLRRQVRSNLIIHSHLALMMSQRGCCCCVCVHVVVLVVVVCVAPVDWSIERRQPTTSTGVSALLLLPASVCAVVAAYLTACDWLVAGRLHLPHLPRKTRPLVVLSLMS